jgi:carbon monoxide dehydrogenase subunit G
MPGFFLRGTVAGTPEAVFAVLTDPANAPRLFAGAAAGRLVSAPPLRAGSRVATARTVEGRTVSGEAVVDVCRPPREFALVASAEGFRVETRWRLVPEGSGTKVEYECRVSGSGLASLLAGAVTDALRRADADHLDRLAAVVGG